MIKEYHQLELWGKKTFEKAIIKPPFKIMAKMPDEACFYYVVKGSGNSITPHGKVEVSSTEGLVMNCGTYFNEYVKQPDLDYCEAIAVHFYPDILKMIYDKEFPGFLTDMRNVQPLSYRKYAASSLLQKYVESIQFYFDHPELVSDELLKLKLKELILLLVKTEEADKIKSLITGLFTPTEINFKEVIESNLFNNLTLEELAQLTLLSLSSFKREFIKHYQTSPAKYIRKRRLEKAARLLIGTELRITDVAYDSGFSDLAHFSKTFQKEFGQSPSAYRLNQNDKSLS